MLPLQTRILPGHDQDRSRLYRLRTTRPSLMPAVFCPLSLATHPSLLTSSCSIADEAHCCLGFHSVCCACRWRYDPCHWTRRTPGGVWRWDNVFCHVVWVINSTVNVYAPDFVTINGVSVDALGRRLEDAVSKTPDSGTSATLLAIIASQQATIAALTGTGAGTTTAVAYGTGHTCAILVDQTVQLLWQ